LEETMHTMTIKLTDLEYKSITTEATKQGISPEEVIDNWLIEGEQTTVPFEPSNSAMAKHDIAERRALSKWHKSLEPAR
jgi:CRISPR/Cas system CMR-associated protein Cmr5 small subunit